jgi:hypothetical protein
VAVFHFLNLCNKICGTFPHICNSIEVLLHVSCVISIQRARIAMSGCALSGTSRRPIIWRHCASRGW